MIRFGIYLLFSSILMSSIFAQAAPKPSSHFDHAIFVIFENTNYDKALQQPFFKKLASQGALLSNYSTITHPSQGNYVALIAGTTAGIKNDKPVNLDLPNIADLLENAGLTWKVYAEDYPGNCFLGNSSMGYARKHIPFISFTNIQNNPHRCANIVNAREFIKDANGNNLPNYIFYIPTLKNDGHDTGAPYADRWYEQNFSQYINNPLFMTNTIIVSTFDEDSGSKKNQVYTSIVGGHVKPGIYQDSLNIYSLLKMVEDNWDLGNLGQQDVTAPVLPNIWK
jgi:hypothetical protein